MIIWLGWIRILRRALRKREEAIQAREDAEAEAQTNRRRIHTVLQDSRPSESMGVVTRRTFVKPTEPTDTPETADDSDATKPPRYEPPRR